MGIEPSNHHHLLPVQTLSLYSCERAHNYLDYIQIKVHLLFVGIWTPNENSQIYFIYILFSPSGAPSGSLKKDTGVNGLKATQNAPIITEIGWIVNKQNIIPSERLERCYNHIKILHIVASIFQMTQKHRTDGAAEITFTCLWCCSLLSDHSSEPLPPQTEQMKSQMRNEGLYLILASCVSILSKRPGETANPANLSFVLVWSSPCKWSAPIKKIWFPVPVSVWWFSFFGGGTRRSALCLASF